MIGKQKYPRALALEVARELTQALQRHCRPDRFIVAGSLRRRKAEVGDVEIVYVPNVTEVKNPDVLFGDPIIANWMDTAINTLLVTKRLRQRENVRGATTWGEKNKLALHVASGIPVDLFATTEEAWWNYLVCRTGSSESNVRIASAAQALGWKWHPYGPGFSRSIGLWEGQRRMQSEREVFEFVGLPYKEPWERC